MASFIHSKTTVLHGLLMETSIKLAQNERELVIATLGINRCCDWNSKLCRWGVGQARESMAQTFTIKHLIPCLILGVKV